jgi:hypothetical protein
MLKSHILWDCSQKLRGHGWLSTIQFIYGTTAMGIETIINILLFSYPFRSDVCKYDELEETIVAAAIVK